MTDIDALIQELETDPNPRDYGKDMSAAAAGLLQNYREITKRAAAALTELRDDRQKLLRTRFENVTEIGKLREALLEVAKIWQDGCDWCEDSCQTAKAALTQPNDISDETQ